VKCDSCGENDATVHITDITDKGKVERNLCEDCFRQQQFAAVQKTVDLAGLLHQLLHDKANEEITGGAAVSCPVCGMSYLEFRSSLRLGCPNDYQVFGEGLLPLLKRIQDGERHCGKVPSRVDGDVHRQNELIRLRRELDRAVQREDYESAAGLRDRIRQLSGGRADVP